MKEKLGLVHVYTGDGKGKTTAALGVALRVLGWGGKVCVVQFIKGYAEIAETKVANLFPEQFVLKQFAVDLVRYIDEEKVMQTRKAAEDAMAYAEDVVAQGDYDLIILDEINNAVYYGLISTERVVLLINNRSPQVELILTGRGAPAELIDAADYVTEMQLIKHPFQQGIPARKGIDY